METVLKHMIRRDFAARNTGDSYNRQYMRADIRRSIRALRAERDGSAQRERNAMARRARNFAAFNF